VISKPVILASSSPSTTQSVNGSSVVRMLHIAPGARVHLNRLTFSGGGGVGATLSGKGGAILNQGSLSLTRCTLTFAKADFGGAIANGMAATPARLKMSRCSISSSAATAQGGAIYNTVSSGGSAVVELDNTVIHTNTATRQGGAVANVGGNGTSTFMAEHCTIMKNTSQSSGGGVFTSTASAITRLTSCLIAENTAAGGGPDVQTTGSLYSGGTNLIGIGDGGTIWAGNDLTGTTAAPLDARTGSEVGSLIPRSGSPAIDAAAVTYRHLFDRADNPRMVDGDLSGTAQPDIGAYEVPAIRITTAVDEFDTPSGASVSLREAIRDASTTANNLLLLDPALSGLTLTLDAALGQIEVGKIISLDASGLAAGFTIDGGTGTNRLFQNLSSMHLRGLRLTGGAVSGDGGAILSTGTLVLEDCTLSGHTATGIGGAVACTSGSLLVKRCAFAGNTATSHGGALACTTTNAGITLENSSFTDNESVARGGAVYLSNSTSISNRMVQCTVAGNRSAQRGGGVMVTNSHLSLLHSTLTQNRAATQRGGGLVMDPGSSFRQTIQNTIIADNYAPTLPDVAVDNQNTSWPLSAGGNLIGQNTGATTQFPTGLPNAAGDYVGSETAPLKGLLAPYGIYGGTTPTCPPMPGSPALDKAVPVTTLNLVGTVPLPGGLTTDQRGFTRSVDGDFNGTARPDIGAAESVIVRVDVAADELDDPAGANDVSLREALRDAPEGAVIGFVPALSGQTLTLNTELVPERAVIITSSGLTNAMVLTPVAGHRIFHLSSGLTAGLSHLGLNGAAITIGPGGAIYNEGSLSLADCSLSGNSSTSSGGAISSRISFSDPRDVSLSLSRCVIWLNQAGGDGGAIDCYASSAGRVSQATLEDCIFNDNSATGSGGAMSSMSGNGLCATTLRRCTFTRNESPSFGGAFTNFSPTFPGRAEALLESCTLNGNSANTGGGVCTSVGFGGTSTATLKQCTITQNEATFQGGGVHNQSSDAGSSSALFLTQCTISGNSPGGGVVGLASNPGNTNTTTLDRCLIAGNGTQDFATFPSPGVPTSSTLTSLGTNLIGNADGSGGPWQTTDLLGTTASPLNPMLADLGSYGGPTQTMPPLPGSPARDRIIDASATGQVDQRGFARLIGPAVDIGAVEAGAADAPGTIAFGTPLIRVQENVGVLQVPVFRTGGNIGTVEVMLATSAGSGAGFATATSDFTPIFGNVLNFGPGETVEYMPITIVSDPMLKEPHEDFTLTLSNVLGGATLGAQSSATVRILDFVDTAVPSLTLTTPLANAKVTDPSVTVSGTAKDDKGVQSVQVQQNGGDWEDATLTGTPILKTFSLPITATPGLNNLVVRSLDEKGKVSALTKRSFTYKVTSTLTVNIGPTNSGTVSAGFAPSSTRDVGLTYKITATPKPGFAFASWYADKAGALNPDYYSNLPTISFVMKPGLTLTASFISLSSMATYAGTYQGVLEPNYGPVTVGNSNVGFATLTVTSTTGVVSGKVLIDGVSQTFAGQVINGSVLFNPTRSGELGIVRKGKPLIVFTAQVSGGTNSNANFVYGGYRDGSFQPDGLIYAYRSPYSSKNKVPDTLVTDTSQRYNLIFPSVPDQPGVSAYPPGTGIGSLILGSDGSAKMAGTLADNTTFTASTTLSSQHTVPLFAPLYTNQGHIAGNINVVGPTGPGYDAFGVNFYWARPAQPKAQWYPLGWTRSLFIDLVGAKYVVPLATANQSVIPGLGPVDATNTNGNATLTFMDGLLTSPQNFPVNISTKNLVTPLPLKTKNFTLKLTPATGEITGTFLHTDTKKPTFKATTIQKPGDYQGTFGFFMSVPPNKTSTAGQAGAAMLLPRP
jgi:predicted outer membrane repeat protein